jgi:alkanesulfonate monooxygenase SsuD/methylene tetrahydromethanopterin reductase-like flavin-dependent oxidoreductase (luciferase family)
VVEEAVLAEAVGIDSFNIGEHYRTDFMDSASHVVLAAIASRTERIRLGSAVTVLSTQDPVRLYTDFATLDAVSHGRAQLIVGRGSLTESFPLFGFDLADYEELFEEKLDLLVRLLREQPVTWSGNFRSALTTVRVRPPAYRASRPGSASAAAHNRSCALRPAVDARSHRGRRAPRPTSAVRAPSTHTAGAADRSYTLGFVADG